VRRLDEGIDRYLRISEHHVATTVLIELPSQLQQVLMNLIVNGIEAMKENELHKEMVSSPTPDFSDRWIGF
jgi:signal transduction histidine kinase